jgi:hypothetical protein
MVSNRPDNWVAKAGPTSEPHWPIWYAGMDWLLPSPLHGARVM